MQFNEKLKSHRIKKGISQAELAKNIFVSRSAVAKWENGLGLPSEESLKLLAEYFGVSVSDLQSDPIQEDIVIEKNSKLSKQKILITVLAVFLVIAAVLSAIFITLNSSHDVDYVPPYNPPADTLSPGRGLMFATEKGLSGDLSSYENNELNSDKEFSPSRAFTIPNFFWHITLPDLVRETAKQADGTSVYEGIRYDDLSLYATDGLWVICDTTANCIYVGLRDHTQVKFTGFVNIQYCDEIVSIKIIKDSTPVESVNIRLLDSDKQPKDWIRLTEEEEIYIDVLPHNATYQNYSYTIEKIEKPDGSLYSDDLSKYAEIDANTLKTTEYIELNSKIYIYATTDFENVKSNTLVVQVTRIPIESISFHTKDFDSRLTAGESYEMSISVYPLEATANLLNEHLDVTLLTPDIATLEYSENGWILTPSSDYLAVYLQKIQVQISAPDDGYSKTFEWTVDPKPIESMTIINAETNAELDDITYLYRGDTLQLNTVIYPENASVLNLTYHYGSNTTNYGAYISISDDGLLTVSDDARFNMEIDLNVTAIGSRSKTYKIIIKQRQVESVTISCETNLAEKGKVFRFSVSYTPSDADITSTRFKLVEDVIGVYISDNMIYVSQDAVVGSKFQVICYYNGVASNILEFTVVESESTE